MTNQKITDSKLPSKVIIAPSILAADYTRFGEQAQEAQSAGAEVIQIDIMDGHFVPNITFGPGIVRALRRAVNIFLDVHLMILEPERFLVDFTNAGADRLIVHQETCPHIYRTLTSIRELGVEAGVSINPGTPLNVLDEILEVADLFQIMTVNPGFGGQVFIPSQLDKIQRLRENLDHKNLDTPIAVDGGIDPTTAPLVVSAGATVLIAGSSIFNTKATVAENIASIRASFEKSLQ